MVVDKKERVPGFFRFIGLGIVEYPHFGPVHFVQIEIGAQQFLDQRVVSGRRVANQQAHAAPSPFPNQAESQRANTSVADVRQRGDRPV